MSTNDTESLNIVETESGIVRDSSLGPVPSTSSVSFAPKDKVDVFERIEKSVEQLQSDTSAIDQPEAISILKSIQTDVRTHGEILTAFIASQHQFQHQVSSEMAAIKGMLEVEQARSANQV